MYIRILPPTTRVPHIGWWDNAARFYTRLGHSHTPSLPPINTQQLIFDGFKIFRYTYLETSCSKQLDLAGLFRRPFRRPFRRALAAFSAVLWLLSMASNMAAAGMGDSCEISS